MGKIIISTELDTSGFEKGYKRLRDASGRFVKNVQDNLGGIQKVVDSAAKTGSGMADRLGQSLDDADKRLENTTDRVKYNADEIELLVKNLGENLRQGAIKAEGFPIEAANALRAVMADIAIQSSSYAQTAKSTADTTSAAVENIEENAEGIGSAFTDVNTHVSNTGDNIVSVTEGATAAITKQRYVVEALRREYEALSSGKAAPKELITLERQLKAAQSDVERLGVAFKELANNKGTARLEAQYAGLRAAGMSDTDIGRQMNLSRLENERAKIAEIKSQWEQAKLKVEEYTSRVSSIRANPLQTDEAQSLQANFSVASQKLSEMEAKAAGVSGATDAATAAAGGLSGVFAAIGKKALQIGEALWKKVGGAIANVTKKAAGFFASFIKGTKRSQTAVEKLLNRIKNLVLAAFVFNVLRKSLSEFREYLNLALKDSERFVTAWGQFKGNIMAAFQPILDFVVPILTTITEALNRASVAVLQFMAALSGKSVKALQSQAKRMDDLKEATEGVGKAAKGTLSSLDEISKIQTPSDASGGSTSGSIAPEYVDIPEPDNRLVEWVDEFKEKLLSLDVDYDYFYNLGKGVGEWITKGLDAIPWDDIQAWAVSIPAKIATFLNGAIAGLNPETIGNTIAQALNTALLAVYTWLTTFDFEAFGTWIAESLNSAIKKTSWKGVGATLAEWFMSVVDSLHAFVSKFKWREFGKRLGVAFNTFFDRVDWQKTGETVKKAIIGIFNMISDFLKEVNWREVGESIKAFFEGLDWASIQAALTELLGEVWTAASETVKGIFGEKAGNTIMAVVKGIGLVLQGLMIVTAAIYVVFGLILAIIGLIGLGLFKLGEGIGWLAVQFSRYVVDPVIAFFGWLSAAVTKIFEVIVQIIAGIVLAVVGLIAIIVESAFNVGKTIGDGIVWLVRKIGEFFSWIGDGAKSVCASIGQFFSDAWEGVKKAWNAAGTFFKGIFDAIVGFFKAIPETLGGFFSSAWEKIKGVWGAVTGWFKGIVDAVTGFFKKLGEDIGSFFTTAWSKIKGVWGAVTGWFSSTIVEPVKGFFKGLGDSIGGFFSSAASKVKEVWGGIASFFTDKIINPIKNGFKGLVNGVIGMFEGLANGFIRALNFIIKGMNKVSFDVPDWVPGIGGSKFGFNISTIKEVSIPRLAAGAVIPPNREYLAILGDQKHGNNIETPEGLLRQIFREESSTSQTVSLLRELIDAVKAGQILTVDKDVLARVTTAAQNRQARQAGRTLGIV